MNQLKSKVNLITALFLASIFFAACSSNNSSNTTSDSASATMYTPGTSDSAAASNSTVDTSTMVTTAPDTSTNASAFKTTSSSTSKKKGKATVILLPEIKNKKVQMDKSGVYDYSEVMPSFPGGQNAIEDYVTNHIEYPEDAINDNKEGRVNVSFTIDENGNISNAHTLGNKLGDGLDEEAVRVVSSMPKWTPGTVKGKAVKARMTLPITFQLEQ